VAFTIAAQLGNEVPVQFAIQLYVVSYAVVFVVSVLSG
jgi:hypothetical protein